MVTYREFVGTASWLRAQCANPGDIFDILLIIGGDIVKQAIAQLSGGYIVPVSFSFGWVRAPEFQRVTLILAELTSICRSAMLSTHA